MALINHHFSLDVWTQTQERNRLEVYVYEEDDCNLFVHHDFEVPAFPLSMAWMNVDPRKPGVCVCCDALVRHRSERHEF